VLYFNQEKGKEIKTMWYITEGQTLSPSAKYRNGYKTWKEVKEVVREKFSHKNERGVSIYHNEELFATGDSWSGCFLVDGSHRKVLPAAPQYETRKNAVKAQRWAMLDEAKKAGYQVRDALKYLNK
jgi:hypothetical protein